MYMELITQAKKDSHQTHQRILVLTCVLMCEARHTNTPQGQEEREI